MDSSTKVVCKQLLWVKETSRYNEDFIESYNEESDEGYLVEVDVQCPEKFHELHNE